MQRTINIKQHVIIQFRIIYPLNLFPKIIKNERHKIMTAYLSV